MKLNNQASDLSKLVEETMSIVDHATSLKTCDQKFVNIHFQDYKKGFYTLSRNGRDLDLPKSLEIFSGDDVYDISIMDSVLNNAISEFLEIPGSFRLVHSEEGPYLLCTRNDLQIKRAA